MNLFLCHSTKKILRLHLKWWNGPHPAPEFISQCRGLPRTSKVTLRPHHGLHQILPLPHYWWDPGLLHTGLQQSRITLQMRGVGHKPGIECYSSFNKGSSERDKLKERQLGRHPKHSWELPTRATATRRMRREEDVHQPGYSTTPMPRQFYITICIIYPHVKKKQVHVAATYSIVQKLCRNLFFNFLAKKANLPAVYKKINKSLEEHRGALAARVLIFTSTWARSSTTETWSRWPCAYHRRRSRAT